MPVVNRSSGEDPEILSVHWGRAMTPVAPSPHTHQAAATGDERGLTCMLTGMSLALQWKCSYTG